MARKTPRATWLLAMSPIVAGCNAVLGVHELDADADASIPICEPGFTPCGSQCVATSTDPENCGSCHHNCQGGGCLGGTCQPVMLASDPNVTSSPWGIAVDETTVYWTKAGAVISVPVGGGKPTTLAPGLNTPFGIAVHGT